MLRRLRTARGMSVRELAAMAHVGKSHVHDLETGRRGPTMRVARSLDQVLGAAGRLTAAMAAESEPTDAAEVEAVELARRVSASDLGSETLDRLEQAADELAMAYAATPPDQLLVRVHRHLGYVASLLDARKTLEQHRRLLVVGGWLALLRATVHVDLRQDPAAHAFLLTAEQFAGQAGHSEIAAWCLETRAWHVLTSGDFRTAVQLAQHAQAVAPRGGSALVQATAQEGRAWARLGDREQTRRTLDRVERMADSRPAPDHPEHHFQYDPGKARSYAATTLAWSGDPAAEGLAREVIAELEVAGGRPRRVATARLDLGLALVAADRPDEAATVAAEAIASGRIAPSSWWRAREVVGRVRLSGVREGRDLRDAYETFRPAQS
nr:helix-turn-helix transcriptional regulator [Krasilnikovia cinnamomea]